MGDLCGVKHCVGNAGAALRCRHMGDGGVFAGDGRRDDGLFAGVITPAT